MCIKFEEPKIHHSKRNTRFIQKRGASTSRQERYLESASKWLKLRKKESSNFFSIVVFRVRSWFSLSSVCSALDRTRSKAASFFKHRPINPFIITIAKICKREKRIRYSSKLGRRTERWWVGLPKRLQRGWTPPWLPWSGFPDHHNPSQRWWMRSAPRRAWSLHGGEWVVSLGCWTEPS